MSLYFYVLDRPLFAERLRPALASSWQRRSFEPVRQVCRDLLPATAAFVERYHVGAEQPLVVAVEQGLPFDKQVWRALVGEMLLFGAVAVPDIQTAPESFCCLLAPEQDPQEYTPRERFAPVQQVYFGSRDLVFGSAVYRPEHAGWNDTDDAARLAAYLESLDPRAWRAADLVGMPALSTEEERAEEVEFLRDWFPSLRDMYKSAHEQNQTVVCERI